MKLLKRLNDWPYTYVIVGIALTVALCLFDYLSQDSARRQTQRPCPILDTTCGTTSGGQKLAQEKGDPKPAPSQVPAPPPDCAGGPNVPQCQALPAGVYGQAPPSPHDLYQAKYRGWEPYNTPMPIAYRGAVGAYCGVLDGSGCEVPACDKDEKPYLHVYAISPALVRWECGGATFAQSKCPGPKPPDSECYGLGCMVCEISDGRYAWTCDTRACKKLSEVEHCEDKKDPVNGGTVRVCGTITKLAFMPPDGGCGRPGYPACPCVPGAPCKPMDTPKPPKPPEPPTVPCGDWCFPQVRA